MVRTRKTARDPSQPFSFSIPEVCAPSRFSERGTIKPNLFRYLSPAALDLVQALLEYNPANRITATNALNTPFFTTEAPEKESPKCVHTVSFQEDYYAHVPLLHHSLTYLDGEWHEYESKRERERTKRKEKRKLEAPLHPSTAPVGAEDSSKAVNVP